MPSLALAGILPSPTALGEEDNRSLDSNPLPEEVAVEKDAEKEKGREPEELAVQEVQSEICMLSNIGLRK